MAKSPHADFLAARTNPAVFRQLLRIDAGGSLVPFADRIDDWQRQDFESLDASWLRVAGLLRCGDTKPVTRAWLERPRGHSKTTDLAVMVCHTLVASGRKLQGIAAAADTDQAKLLLAAIDGLVRQNPFLQEFLEITNLRVTNRHTGSELMVISSDAKTSYGLTPDFVVADEVTHWAKEDLWVSLLSAAAKREHCLLVVITNAGFAESWQWGVRDLVMGSDEWYFRHLDGPHASWITEAVLAEQRKLLPALAYRRLWLNEWSAGSGDALTGDDIRAAVTLDGPLSSPEPGWTYSMGVDLGLARDHSACVIVGRHVGHDELITGEVVQLSLAERAMVEAGWSDYPVPRCHTVHHPGTGRQKLVAVVSWSPPPGGKISLTDVEASIDRLAKRFRVSRIGADPWQAAMLIERLRAMGHFIEPVDFVSSNLKSMASAVCEAFTERNIDLFPHDKLLSDLSRLRVEEKSYGVRLTSPRGPDGHGDCATAFAIAMHLQRKYIGEFRAARIDGELICWP